MQTRRPVQFPNSYVWLVFVSCLDIMMTWIVLWRGGREVNVLANAILHQFGLVGIVLFKLSLVITLVLVCELIGRRNSLAAARLAKAAVVVSLLPVLVAFALLA